MVREKREGQTGCLVVGGALVMGGAIDVVEGTSGGTPVVGVGIVGGAPVVGGASVMTELLTMSRALAVCDRELVREG